MKFLCLANADPATGRRQAGCADIEDVVAIVAVGSHAASQRAAAPTSSPESRGTGLIVGHVVDATGGAPIAGAVVTLDGTGVTRRVLTESKGRFVFRDLPAGSFLISSSKPGWDDGAYGRRRQSRRIRTAQTVSDGTYAIPDSHDAIGGHAPPTCLTFDSSILGRP